LAHELSMRDLLFGRIYFITRFFPSWKTTVFCICDPVVFVLFGKSKFPFPSLFTCLIWHWLMMNERYMQLLKLESWNPFIHGQFKYACLSCRKSYRCLLIFSWLAQFHLTCFVEHPPKVADNANEQERQGESLRACMKAAQWTPPTRAKFSTIGTAVDPKIHLTQDVYILHIYLMMIERWCWQFVMNPLVQGLRLLFLEKRPAMLYSFLLSFVNFNNYCQIRCKLWRLYLIRLTLQMLNYMTYFD